MSSNRVIYGLLGVGALGGGYYFYSAGGDPKVAKHMAERQYSWHSPLTGALNAHAHTDDASRASAKVKSEMPGSGKEMKKEGEVWAEKAGRQLDQTVRHSPHTSP